MYIRMGYICLRVAKLKYEFMDFCCGGTNINTFCCEAKWQRVLIILAVAFARISVGFLWLRCF